MWKLSIQPHTSRGERKKSSQSRETSSITSMTDAVRYGHEIWHCLTVPRQVIQNYDFTSYSFAGQLTNRPLITGRRFESAQFLPSGDFDRETRLVSAAKRQNIGGIRPTAAHTYNFFHSSPRMRRIKSGITFPFEIR